MIDYTGIPDTLNERIKFIRLKHNYKQEDIANLLSVSRVTYTKYETGKRGIPTEVIIGLAKIYSLTTDFILGLSAKPDYVDYKNFLIGLSDTAMYNLQSIFNEKSQYAFKALRSLLESRYSLGALGMLGILMQIPPSINIDDFRCNDEIAEVILFEHTQDFKAEIPTDIFDMDVENIIFGNIDVDMAYEAYFNAYMKKIIDEKRNSPETKKCFVNKLMKKYHKYIKEEYDEIQSELTEDEE